MKQIVLTYIFALTALFSTAQNSGADYRGIKVANPMKPYVLTFIDIMDNECIEIDYSKIKSVDVLPLSRGFYGIWSTVSNTVTISAYHSFPLGATEEEKDGLLLLTLAHEIGHGLGFEHTDPLHMGLMNPSGKFDLTAIRSMGVEHYIAICYRAELKKLEQEKSPN